MTRPACTDWRLIAEYTATTNAIPASHREPAELEMLSSAERKDCIALWDKLDVLFGRCGPR